MLLAEENDLRPEEQTYCARLRELCPEVHTAVTLARAFFQMVRERKADQFETWQQTVHESAVAELRRFAAGLEQDKAAVARALSEPWSNGVVEGHVNRLKLIKRQMYGRAKFDLLRQRVLHAA